MEFEEVWKLVEGRPMAGFNEDLCKMHYDYIVENKCRTIFEIGSFTGSLTAVLAAAAEETKGHVFCVDTHANAKYLTRPFMGQLGFDKRMVTVYAADQIDFARQNKLAIDYLVMDSDHSWNSQGFAFLILEQNLKTEGIVAFDDVWWTAYDGEKNPVLTFIQKFVVTNPHFDDLKMDNNCWWFRKKRCRWQYKHILEQEKRVREELGGK